MKTKIITRGKSRTNGNNRFAAVEAVMRNFGYAEHSLVEVLMCAQETYGFLSKELLEYVAKKLKLPLSRVYGVATFYDMFTLEESGGATCLICMGPTCATLGSKALQTEILKQANASQPQPSHGNKPVNVKEVSCLGLCDQGPAALINKKAQVNLQITDIPALLQGKAEEPRIQVAGKPRELTANIGRLPPTDLQEHLHQGAFSALEKALWEMTPEQVIQEVKESRLTGRGGAGFSTGLKWEYASKARAAPKYVICNFDESEPGTFKDRALMEGDPFRVLEGLILSAYATQAETGYVFIRGEYPAAHAVLDEAIDELYTANLAGEHILGTDYHLDIEVRQNAGAYICGEETALFESIEGKRGYPRHKPPYPTQAGLFGQPTAINNVETLAVIPSLVTHGGEWFHQWGTAESVGLKLFCLSGHVHNPGVVEAPFGLTVRELIEDFGGGFNGRPQAVLIGGAAGGFMHPDALDTPLTHEHLHPLHIPIGSGAIMVFNETVDLHQVIQDLAHFFVHECCGQCAPCRLGTNQIYKLLQKMDDNPNISSSIMQNALQLGQTIKSTCVCGLGMTAANPLLTYQTNIAGAALYK